ncbi:hypothetical protein RM550_28005 [Streptomyces sp. DSM 41527]|uniref:Uncharacterized protein n=1 Tax=Streptomyces mooreae TaxID=3075523 RepID=A0ABU2TEZ5_9ACTN|nr:hypothetical protein [Streptomyces sp. DSM 41527]MDT0459514.1 hypothetical protein [Streptomyces sp. DSM 41527]
MIDYGFEAVRKSLAQMRGSDPVHKPVIGRAVPARRLSGSHAAESARTHR